MKGDATFSFASRVKEEINRLERDESEKRSLLSAFLRQSAHLFYGKKPYLDIESESALTAKTIYLYLHELYEVNARFSYTRSSAFHHNLRYHVILEERIDEVLDNLSIDFLIRKSPLKLLNDLKSRVAFLVGAFLAGGSVNDPISSNYHLEIVSAHEEEALFLKDLLNHHLNVAFHAKTIERRGKYVLYLKRSNEISDFLIILGAKECCLDFENVRVDRDFANIGNRLDNFDQANFSKTLLASTKQLKAIEVLEKEGRLSALGGEKIQMLVEIRKKHQDASMEEIAKLLSEALNSEVSKSNINHMFRKIIEEAHLE